MEKKSKKTRAVSEVKHPRCVLCGGCSPNVYGECLCSYEEVMLSGDYEKVARHLGKLVKKLLFKN